MTTTPPPAAGDPSTRYPAEAAVTEPVVASFTAIAAAESVLGRLGAAHTEMAALDESDLQSLSSAELLEVLDAVEALDRKVQGLTHRVLAAAETDGMWATTGARSFSAFYRARTGRHHSRAHTGVRNARRLRDHLPGTAGALTAGHISTDHAHAMATHAAATPTTRSQLQHPDLGEDFLLKHARTMGATEFTHLLKHWADRADPAAADRSYKEDTEREQVTLAPTTDGYHLSGWLTTANGQALQTALDARIGTPAATDTPTAGQRRASALNSLARHVLDSGTLQPGARIRPHLAVHVPYDTLTRLIAATAGHHPHCPVTTGTPLNTGTTSAAGASTATGSAFRAPTCTCPTRPTRQSVPGPEDDFLIPGIVEHDALVGAESATLADGTPIAPSLLGRLACGGAFHRVIFGPDSEVLDVGREKRLFTAAQTRAIVARDRTCRYPDCHAPPNEGEIHHSLSWYDQWGDTATHLGVLLCWAHHDYVHAHHITVERTGEDWTFTRPDGTGITSIRTNLVS